MTEQTFKLTIVAPMTHARKRTKSIYEAISASARDISGWSYELFLADAGSADGTFAELKEIAEQDSLVRVLSLPREATRLDVFEFAAEKGEGDYFCFLDPLAGDPADVVSEMVMLLSNGADIVNGRRMEDQDAPLAQRLIERGRRDKALKDGRVNLGAQTMHADIAKALAPMRGKGRQAFEASIRSNAQTVDFVYPSEAATRMRNKMMNAPLAWLSDAKERPTRFAFDIAALFGGGALGLSIYAATTAGASDLLFQGTGALMIVSGLFVGLAAMLEPVTGTLTLTKDMIDEADIIMGEANHPALPSPAENAGIEGEDETFAANDEATPDAALAEAA